MTTTQANNCTIERRPKGDNWVITVTDGNGHQYPPFLELSASDISASAHKTKIKTYIKANVPFYVSPATESYGAVEKI